MSFSPYFPTGFLKGVFHGIQCIFSIFPTGFLEKIIPKDDQSQGHTRIRGSVRI